MAGDISRSSFQRAKHNSSVRMQQGRVQLDADWNEQLDIAAYHDRRLTVDLIGAAAAPLHDAGFAISLDGGQLVVGAGRMYVGGLLCENESEVLVVAPLAPPSAPATGGGSDGGEGDPSMDAEPVAAMHAASLRAKDIGLAGRRSLLGPGLLQALGDGRAAAPHTATSPVPLQPNLPGATAPAAAGNYLAYLDVWEREITALEDPSIREVALGGPDTTTRNRVVWQVKLAPQLGTSCGTDISDLILESSGEMSAQAAPSPTAVTPCAVAATAGYRSLENQLYRVEMHTGGIASPVGKASLKWSRDNASVLVAWQGQGASGGQLTVSSLGKDNVLGFAAGQWVELLDDVHELSGTPGAMAQLSSAQLLAGVPTLSVGASFGSTNWTDYSGTPKVRRWDHAAVTTGPSPDGAIPLTEGGAIDLEEGVQVTFVPGGYYNTGDYWLIPARTATVSSQPIVLWPVDPVSSQPVPQPPNGIEHQYAPLAVIGFDGASTWNLFSDCRSTFAPISTPDAVQVLAVQTIDTGLPLASGMAVSAAQLLDGLRIVCDETLDAGALNVSTLAVTIDLPAFDAETSSPVGQLPAALPIKVMANYAVSSDGKTASWVPLPSARRYFANALSNLNVQTVGEGQALVQILLRTDAVRLGHTASPLPGDGDASALFTMSLWTAPYADMTDLTGFVPFLYTTSMHGPDASGDYVAVGRMAGNVFAELQQLPLPNVTPQLYYQPLMIAPNVLVRAYVPTAAERVGNFSTFGLMLQDPNTGGFFGGNFIPSGDWPFSGAPAATPHVEAEEGAGSIHEPAPHGGDLEPAVRSAIGTASGSKVPTVPVTPTDRVGVFAWRFRAYIQQSAYYGYGYGYGYGAGAAIGAELI